MLTDYPPPKLHGHPTKVVAWFMLALAAFAIMVTASSVIVRVSEGNGALPVVVYVIAAVGGTAVISTALGLLHSRSWALAASAAELLLGAAACFGLTVYLVRNPPGPPGTDGAGYDVLGAASWGFILLALSIVVLAPSNRRTLRNPPAAWYLDPARQATWRYWDGSGWSTSVAGLISPDER